MKYISEMKPVVQTSFEIGVCEPEDIIISAEDTRLGTLYFSSNMPSFRQTAIPALVTKEKTYRRNGKVINVTTQTLHFPGNYIDEYKDTIAYCPHCGRQLDANGTISNELRHLPIGDTYTTLDIRRRRLRCVNSKCRYIYDCPIDFKAPRHFITEQLLSFTQDLLARHYTLKTVAELTGLNKNVVKEIDMERLKTLYTVKGEGKVLKNPEQRAEFLAVDEFKLHDGHKYATVIIDLDTGHVLHLAHGRKKSAIYEFIDRVGLEWMSSVKAIACDMLFYMRNNISYPERCVILKDSL